MSQRVLVTGASGNAGREVVSALEKHNPDVKIIVAGRDTQILATDGKNKESIYLDFNKTETFLPSVSNCTSIFLLRPPAISNVKNTLNRFIDTARKCGVRQIVFLSVAGAGQNKIIPHYAIEQHLRKGPDDWTILRPGFFAQNLASAYRDDIMQDDRIYVPAGNGKVTFVDLRDVGKVAAETLTSSEQHQAATYTLTGPASYSFYEVADMLSKHLNRKINYVPASIPGYFFHLFKNRNLGIKQSLVQTILHVGLRYGHAKEVDPTLEHLLNREPNTVETYIQDHKDIWRA